jgi:alkanesulfonate monooxygenase SsuD/methylene tetrahydromethanopterin reductase-like flavin-dependent oxidoreductase (luciferase family)
MLFDIFFSICQTEVGGVIPSERVMFENFFEQVRAADRLGFGTGWLAESHLSCEVQKRNPAPVIPHFKGEIAVNVDFLQLAQKVFSITERIHMGSAVLNILCNGGPIAQAERIRLFLTLHGLTPGEKRHIEVGFAAGRFPFINVPYGIVPRSPVETAGWGVVKNKVFRQATEIFLRLLRGDVLSSDDIEPLTLARGDFRKDEEWQAVLAAHGRRAAEIKVPNFYNFPDLTIVPRETGLDLLRLTIGSHDPEVQNFANTFLPVGVFNLSITPSEVIESTNRRMQAAYHPDGGPWKRAYMPRTVLVFINEDDGAKRDERIRRATASAEDALQNYWKALEGTIDPEKVRQAVSNALVGDAQAIAEQIRERFHPEDRLMLWFDFNNHNSAQVVRSMELFMESVAPHFQGALVP